MQQIDFSLLRSEFMISEEHAHELSSAALHYLAGKTLNVGLFSKLNLPDVPENVALIPVNGVMTKADVCGGMGTRTLANIVASAAADPQYKSIILFFETVPGGQVDGTEEFANAITKAKSAKPVIGVVSGLLASAGVWAGSQCNELYAMSHTDQIGCIGVMAKMRKKDQEEEARYEVIYSDLSPDKNAEYRDTQLFKENYLNPTARLFQDAVKAGRGDRLKASADGVLSGKTFISKDAKKNGLIDGIMPFSKVVDRANYLSKRHTMNTSKNTGKAVFQTLLAVCDACSFLVTDDGFALSEDQMSSLDAHLAAADTRVAELTSVSRVASLEQQVAQLTAAAAEHTQALTDANARADAAEASLATSAQEVTALNAKVIAMGGKPAPTAANPTAAADPVTTRADAFMTSTDRMLAERKRKRGA